MYSLIEVHAPGPLVGQCPHMYSGTKRTGLANN